MDVVDEISEIDRISSLIKDANDCCNVEAIIELAAECLNSAYSEKLIAEADKYLTRSYLDLVTEDDCTRLEKRWTFIAKLKLQFRLPTKAAHLLRLLYADEERLIKCNNNNDDAYSSKVGKLLDGYFTQLLQEFATNTLIAARDFHAGLNSILINLIEQSAFFTSHFRKFWVVESILTTSYQHFSYRDAYESVAIGQVGQGRFSKTTLTA